MNQMGLPSPEEIDALKKLDVELPWLSAELQMQVKHLRRMDNARMVLAFVGPVFGLVVVLSFLGMSGWLIDRGHGLEGTVLGTVDLVALAAVFVIGAPGKGHKQASAEDVLVSPAAEPAE